MREHTAAIQRAKDAAECFYHIVLSDQVDQVFETYAVMSEAGNTNDVTDPFFSEEERFFQTVKPEYAVCRAERNAAILNSPFRDALRPLIGDIFFSAAEMRGRIASTAVAALEQEENIWSQRYSDLVANLKVESDGQAYNMADLRRLGNHEDHEVRKKYARLTDNAWMAIAPELDECYDEMLKIRHQMAATTGFHSFTDFCLYKHARTDYGRKELKYFAESVVEHIVPQLNRWYEENIGQCDHTVFDFDEAFLQEGNITAPVDPVSVCRHVFDQLAPEASCFYKEFADREFYDISIRPGKLNGAYSNGVPLAGLPYIFETYNETDGAFKTFIHECGHGLHTWLHRGDLLKCLSHCTSEIGETHAIGMEYLTLPLLKDVFTDKERTLYEERMLFGSLSFICYGTAIDQFQTEVYDNPALTPAERLSLWQSVEQRFLPWRHYLPDSFLEAGRAWQRQIHVMKWPFYYIDYVLAQTVALQFWQRSKEDWSATIQQYLDFSRRSGRDGFSTLLVSSGLTSPFEEGAIATLATAVMTALQEGKQG